LSLLFLYFGKLSLKMRGLFLRSFGKFVRQLSKFVLNWHKLAYFLSCASAGCLSRKKRPGICESTMKQYFIGAGQTLTERWNCFGQTRSLQFPRTNRILPARLIQSRDGVAQAKPDNAFFCLKSSGRRQVQGKLSVRHSEKPFVADELDHRLIINHGIFARRQELHGDSIPKGAGINLKWS
jgi:hypothetical protein